MTATRPAARRSGRVARFAAVGASGVLANLGALAVYAGVLRAPEVVASALAIETSILWNFALHERFTFPDRLEGTSRAARLLRYHAVSLGGFVVQLLTFALAGAALLHATGRSNLGALRYLAQLAGIGAGFAWSWAGSAAFAWPEPGRVKEPLAGGALLASVAFGVLVVLHVLPIWLVPYFPTQDGPLHVENVLALLHHSGSPLLQRWYVANWGAQPNWLTQALFAGLLPFATPIVAEKLVLTGYTVLFPLAFRAVLPRGARGWWAALAGFAFVHAYPFHMGFWNFCYGVALAFLAAGLWARHRGRLGPGRLVLLAALAILIFLAHTVALAGFLATAGALLAWRAGLSLWRSRGHPARRRLVVRGYGLRAAGLVAVAGPGLALALTWIGAHRGHASMRISFLELAAKLAAAYTLVSIDRRELLVGAGVSLALLVAAAHAVLVRLGRSARLRPNDGWILAALGFVVLYFAVPEVVAAGAHISDRFALLAFLCLVAWLGTAAPRAGIRRLGATLAAVSVAALIIRFEKQLELSSYLEEYASSKGAVKDGEVLLSLAMAPWGPRDDEGERLGYRVKVFLHAAGWIVAERGGVDLKNSQANTDHCPVRFQADRNPFRAIAFGADGRLEGLPPCVDLRAPLAEAADLVLVWGASPETLETRCGASLASDLAARYVPVYRSAPRGMLEVWRPRASLATR